MSKHAVIVVDLQNEYLPTGNLPLAGIDTALANAARVIADARSSGNTVVHIRHESTDVDAPFFAPGSNAVQIHPTVAPTDGEPVVVKNYPNAFLKTELKQILDAQGIEGFLSLPDGREASAPARQPAPPASTGPSQ